MRYRGGGVGHKFNRELLDEQLEITDSDTAQPTGEDDLDEDSGDSDHDLQDQDESDDSELGDADYLLQLIQDGDDDDDDDDPNLGEGDDNGIEDEY